MYAFIELAGHQHKIEKDMVFLSDKTGQKKESEFLCSNVLLCSDGKDLRVGHPFVEGVNVKLKVLEDVLAPKIIGFKYKKRKGYRRRWGHRHQLQKLKVLSIEK